MLRSTLPSGCTRPSTFGAGGFVFVIFFKIKAELTRNENELPLHGVLRSERVPLCGEVERCASHRFSLSHRAHTHTHHQTPILRCDRSLPALSKKHIVTDHKWPRQPHPSSFLIVFKPRQVKHVARSPHPYCHKPCPTSDHQRSSTTCKKLLGASVCWLLVASGAALLVATSSSFSISAVGAALTRLLCAAGGSTESISPACSKLILAMASTY